MLVIAKSYQKSRTLTNKQNKNKKCKIISFLKIPEIDLAYLKHCSNIEPSCQKIYKTKYSQLTL